MRPLALVLLLGCSASPSLRQGPPMEAGTAAVDITPPAAYFMSGYYSERKNTGVRDPILAKAIVFRQGDTAAALVVCDVCFITPDLTREVRKRAGPATGIPMENIVVAATHTHTGPEYAPDLKKWIDAQDPSAYPARLIRGIVDSIVAAHRAAGPARLAAAVGRQEEEIAFCRRFVMKDGLVRTWATFRDPNTVREANPTDPDVAVLTIRRGGGSAPVAALVNFALHLDTLGGTSYSADFPHDLQESLREDLGRDFLAVFANGCCGDINHINPRAEKRNPTDVIGRSLARTVKATLPRVAEVAGPLLAVRRAIVDAPLQGFTDPDLEWARREVAANPDGRKGKFLDSVRAWKLLELEQLRKGGRDRLALEVHAIRLGADTAIVTLPGEVFVELGLVIKKASPFRNTFVVELANTADTQYIPKREAYPLGGYEVENSTLAAGGGELLAEAAIRLLKELGP